MSAIIAEIEKLLPAMADEMPNLVARLLRQIMDENIAIAARVQQITEAEG